PFPTRRSSDLAAATSSAATPKSKASTRRGPPNPNVTWEVATQRDIGLDATLLQNRLSIVFDYFKERRNNILWNRNASVPQTAGLSLPRENIGQVSSWGYDGSIGWRDDRAGGVSYDVTFNFGHA